MRQHGKVSEVTEKKTAVYVDDQQRILIPSGWLWRSERPADLHLRRWLARGGLAALGLPATCWLVYRLVYGLTA
jgi:hypothetical protein